MSDQPATLAEALARVQSQIPVVERRHVGNVRSEKANYSYKYADLQDVSQSILPLLGQNGLSWMCRPTTTENGFVLAYTLTHTCGEAIEGTWPLPDPTRAAPQQMGSYITYARRYALCAVTGIAPGDDDDDGVAAMHQEQFERSERRVRSSDLRRRSSGTRPVTGQTSRTGPSPAASGASDADGTRPAGDNPDEGGQDFAQAMTEGTRRLLMSKFTDAGFTAKDRERRHRTCSKIVRREVTTERPPTQGEARRIIAEFEKQQDPAAWVRVLLGEDTPAEQPAGDEEITEDARDGSDVAPDLGDGGERSPLD
jgi:hypothetical protein